MRPSGLNYRHLYYFWMTAKEGNVTKASASIGVAVQTVSMQISLLEEFIGKTLFVQQGRRMELTVPGKVAFEYADRIFSLGARLREALGNERSSQQIRISVGVSESLPKTKIFHLLEPIIKQPGYFLQCREGNQSELLVDLSERKLDIVFGQKSTALIENARFTSHELGQESVWLYGVDTFVRKYKDNFPACLDGAPMLLPAKSHAVRHRLDHWFETHGIQPQVVGEFDDIATLEIFASHGMGMFCAPWVLAVEMREYYHSSPIAEMEGMSERYYAIVGNHYASNPIVEKILSACKADGF